MCQKTVTTMEKDRDGLEMDVQGYHASGEPLAISISGEYSGA